ncbi:hypothetical protein J4437_04100 [Candidatus Woesearchaeota archaeon]|nr:hypothetical protein [uncultured archaeon]MBS3123793.1 hypothetical protein [Candidatus Woesearchaeota archaeon]
MTLFTNVRKEDLRPLYKEGFVEEEIKTTYEQLRLKKNNLILVLYTSGKLLLQGKKKEIDETSQLLKKHGVGEKQKTGTYRSEVGWIIGSDECLKGDTFGGIVVAAVKGDEKVRKQLIELGVADSKKLGDKEILLMAEKIKNITSCQIKSLLPEEYNTFKGNVTELLNNLHQECASFLMPGMHVVDKYPGCDVGSIQEEKAESKYVEVAAASILARSTGLKQLDFLSAQAGFTLPKGSTHVSEALKELKEREYNFKKFVKVDFKNVREFMRGK